MGRRVLGSKGFSCWSLWRESTSRSCPRHCSGEPGNQAQLLLGLTQPLPPSEGSKFLVHRPFLPQAVWHPWQRHTYSACSLDQSYQSVCWGSHKHPRWEGDSALPKGTAQTPPERQPWPKLPTSELTLEYPTTALLIKKKSRTDSKSTSQLQVHYTAAWPPFINCNENDPGFLASKNLAISSFIPNTLLNSKSTWKTSNGVAGISACPAPGCAFTFPYAACPPTFMSIHGKPKHLLTSEGKCPRT